MTDEKNNLIEVKVLRDNGDMKIYLKACKEFEDYLKATRKLTKKTNFCNLNKTYEFYDKRIDGLTQNAEHDSGIRDLISHNNKINFAILRIKGISNGVEIPLNKLISLEDLNLSLRRFILEFKNFYKEFIKKFEISVSINYNDIII